MGRSEGLPYDPWDWFGTGWQGSSLSSRPHLSSGYERENRFCFLIFIVKGKRLKDAREMKSCENHF